MGDSAEVELFRFGVFELNPHTGELRRQGLKVRLQGQPIQILTILLQRSGELVSREQLREELWPSSTYVDFDHGLNSAISRLREALQDSSTNPRFIETLPRRGYRFIGPVLGPEDGASLPQASKSNDLSGRKTAKRWLAAASAVLAVLLAASYLGWEGREAIPEGPPEKIMLAVLPFENVSDEAGQEYFTSGLTWEVISQLGSLPVESLGVIAHSSVSKYTEGPPRSIPEIGGELDVEYILEGGVRRDGDRVRINVQLIQVSDQSRIWTETYDGTVLNVFGIQSEVARGVARSLSLRLFPTPGEDPTLSALSAEAHDDYLRGRYFLDSGRLDKGLEAFQAAVEKAPEYAAAYAGLADAYRQLGSGRILPPPEAYVALAWVALAYDWDWTLVEQSARRAIALNSNLPTAREVYGEYLMRMGRQGQALDAFKTARKLDPLSLVVNGRFGWHAYFGRDYPRAIELMRKRIELDPDSGWQHHSLGEFYAEAGLTEEAKSELLMAIALGGEVPHFVAALGYAHALAGDRRAAGESIAELKRKMDETYVSPHDIAIIHAGLGDKESAVSWLERAYQERDAWMSLLKVEPKLDSLRADPGFQNLLRRMNFPEAPALSPRR